MNTSEKLKFISLLDAYPIFTEYKNMGTKGLRCKLALVSHLVSLTSGMGYEVVLKSACEIRGVTSTMIPPLPEAAYWARISMNFLQDYSKIQYLFEHNSSMQEMNNLIRNHTLS